jgi:thymidylate kinase
MRSKLIIVEGIDASGKKTQVEMIVKRLKKENRKVEALHFPIILPVGVS